MSGTYTWPITVNGKTYYEADFRPFGYAAALPDLLGNFAAQAASAQGAVQAANAAASAAAAAVSAAQAADRVAGVTAGSTANLVYPEAVANLVTADDVRDVFIYDTRLDSDGGAWRLQSGHTSWYQEALNTATRGAKREFPAVALIVLRAGSMTIYDLHDLDGSGAPRMWMVFNGGGNNHLLILSGAVPSSVVASNGYVAVTTTEPVDNGRIIRIGFTGDETFVFSSYNAGRYDGRIGARNSEANGYVITSYAQIAANNCKQAAMRVLPGALRDVAGLPIPTIVVATTGGISVIHPDGRIVSLTGNFGQVSFVSDTHLSGLFGADAGAVGYYAIPYATAAESGQRAALYYSGLSGNLNYAVGSQVTIGPQASGGTSGLVSFAHELANPINGMVAVAAHTHATGWQPGNIRLATLCDARTGALASDIRLTLDGTSVVGFTSANSGTVTSTSGRIRIARNGVNDPGAFMVMSGLAAGEAYTVDFDAFVGTATGWIVAVNGSVTLLSVTGATDASGQRAQFVADQTTATLVFYALTSTGTQYAEFDNVTVRRGVADRSYRARGLHAVGTMSRAPAGTGNDVVAYSGFSTSNYLDQPYSSLLDFGTGDFCVAFWARGGSNFEFIMDRRTPVTGAGAGFYCGLTTGNAFEFVCTDGTSYPAVISTSVAVAGVWKFVLVTRRAGVVEMWVDGVREATNSASMSVSASVPLIIGASAIPANPLINGALSMLRFAAYAPTPAQIARMYRDEAPLFDAGAKAFLGGTSSAVNDLSFSEQSRRLAVATADGVSVFSGLRRVEYLSIGNLSPAMGANNTSKVALEAGALMVGTTGNAGVRRDAVIGLDRMQAARRAPFSPRLITARGVTTDATPLALAPRLHIGERETLIVQATIVGRVFGAADGQRIGYQRRATYYRDAGGNVTLQGSVQTIGTDTEVTGTADATLLIDTTAQTVTPQVTGVASTRIVWTATLETTRIADAQYEETV
jgi:hypothetical protein